MFARRPSDDTADIHGAVRWLFEVLALGLAFALPGATTEAHAQASSPEKRIALVIGNARYPKAPLSNPENDARLIAGNLRKLGFDVNEQLNVNVQQFRRALRDFARLVQEDDAVAVLYYAGHGVQIDGRNYLLPIDINLRDQEEVKDESVDIEELFLSRIDKTGSHPRIVILDACRDNPFATKTRNIRAAGGLAEMGARGTLIGFASAPGAPAEDGPIGSNGVYTKNLAEEMMVPGIEVEQMFKNVRVKVLRDTNQRQLPWVNTSLTSNFSFNPLPSQPLPGAASRPEAEAAPGPEPRPVAHKSSLLASASATSGTAGSAPSKLESNELEQLLARAQRELDKAQAGVPKSIPQSAPQSALVSVPAPLLPTRNFLDRDEVQQLLVGKTHTLTDATAGYRMHWDMRADGQIYYKSENPGAIGSNGSGRWDLKNDGRLCVKFDRPLPPSGRLNNAPNADGRCWHIFREGEKLMRISTTTVPHAQARTEIVESQAQTEIAGAQAPVFLNSEEGRPTQCRDIVLKSTMESLRSEEVAYLKRECR
ncbi:caspase family protein [Variovorax guangxiensis]|uniref:caspase family protein n=1 Tax=Variovorax guangxiensis TaxID=1775474 RepID=UPI00285CEB37|nr:caspase family protein [Variovorax guangxiensis]MDR6859828.1 hypothetical protein [Variovorax guangxiensis]